MGSLERDAAYHLIARGIALRQASRTHGGCVLRLLTGNAPYRLPIRTRWVPAAHKHQEEAYASRAMATSGMRA